ncbi:TatD related DNase-domain-containing protein [Zopfochytrium polystomum]|nr:TatD related DNase-domain-containing protein [Zopfochytrium polystomum]
MMTADPPQQPPTTWSASPSPSTSPAFSPPPSSSSSSSSSSLSSSPSPSRNPTETQDRGQDDARHQADLEPSSWSCLHDVHCHIAESPSVVPTAAPPIRVGHLWVMGTHPGDWNEVDACRMAFAPGRVVCAYGVHPWFVNAVATKTLPAPKVSLELETSPLTTYAAATPAWLDLLRERLATNPDALLGEIGLDAVAVDPTTKEKYPMPDQIRLFSLQLDLASEMKRPVSVHAVRCPGKILELFQERAKQLVAALASGPSRKEKRKMYKDRSAAGPSTEHTPTTTPAGAVPISASASAAGTLPTSITSGLASNSRSVVTAAEAAADAAFPPAVMLHSFSGPPELVQNLLRLPRPVASRFYFSFSTVVNARSADAEKTRARIAAVPDDRILIESDLHDARLIDDACVAACRLVAGAKGWSLADTARRTAENAARFLASRGGGSVLKTFRRV